MKNTLATSELQSYRKTIDHLDASLMFLLAERCHIISKITMTKKQQRLPMKYSEERKQDLQKVMDFAIQHNLKATFLKKLFHCIFCFAKKNTPPSFPSYTQTEMADNLIELRRSLFNLDIALCAILAERFHISLKIANYKKQNLLPLLDEKRWDALLKIKLTMAKKLGVAESLVVNIFNIIHQESLRLQKTTLEIDLSTKENHEHS